MLRSWGPAPSVSPLGEAKRVEVMPSLPARSFILVTKAAVEPARSTARATAASFADCSMRAKSSSSTEKVSPSASQT